MPSLIFPNKADIEKIRPGFTDALAAEVDTIVKHIPNSDLAIQWDCSTEVQDAYGAVQCSSADGAIEPTTAQFPVLPPRIPDTVDLSYPLCFPTPASSPPLPPRA